MRKEQLLHFASYVVVGGLATFVEWVCYYFFDPVLHLNTYLAVALSFIFSTFANWLAGRLITFRQAGKNNIWKELLEIYGASIIGLLLNEIIMLFFMNLIFSDQTDFKKMIAKVIATGIVFFWNYFVRTLYIYKEK